MENFKNNCKVIVVLCCFNVVFSGDTESSELNAKMLVALGRKLNKPLITLIGIVMENYHLCTDWSEWTNCGTMTLNHFATRSRTRHCALIRSQTGKGIPEEETDVCEGICPPAYNLTKNGLCMKLYITDLNRNDAETTCKSDGGRLIQINTDEKYDDVKALLTANDVKHSIHIDGRRENSTSPWEYSNGSGHGFLYWYEGHPSTSENYLCLMLSGYRTDIDKRFRWFDYPCRTYGPFVCEPVS